MLVYLGKIGKICHPFSGFMELEEIRMKKPFREFLTKAIKTQDSSGDTDRIVFFKNIGCDKAAHLAESFNAGQISHTDQERLSGLFLHVIFCNNQHCPAREMILVNKK